VYTLRNYNDFEKIKKASLRTQNITIVGASFIGMELASSIKKFNPKAEITLLDDIPFKKVLGNEVGIAIKKYNKIIYMYN
jgi:apoptosis-inducing factor 3